MYCVHTTIHCRILDGEVRGIWHMGIWWYNGIRGIQSLETGVLSWLNGNHLSFQTKLAVSAGGPEHAKSMFPTWRCHWMSTQVVSNDIQMISNMHLPDLVCIVLETDDRIGCLEAWVIQVTGCKLSFCSILCYTMSHYLYQRIQYSMSKNNHLSWHQNPGMS